MGQGLQDFYYQAQRRNFARDYQFRVMQLGTVPLGESDFIMITSATLPGRELSNHQLKHMGLSFNLPGTVMYPGSDNWNITFYANQDFLTRQQLENNQLAIFDDQGKGPVGTGGTGDLSLPGYTDIIHLDLIGDDLRIIRTYYLIGAYVKSIGQMQYDLTGNGAPLKFEASMAYQYWTRNPKGISEGLLDTISDGASRVSEMAGNVGGAAQSIANLFR